MAHDGPAAATWPALGTSATVVVVDAPYLACARERVFAELSAIDRACSRFRPDSELTRLNAGDGRPVAVGALLIEAVQVALRAARLTGGDVDPTLGAQLALNGYDRDWSLLAHACVDDPPATLPAGPGARWADELWLRANGLSVARTTRVRATARNGWQRVQVDPVQGTIRLPRGVALDLGATAKALAADRCARAAHAATGTGVLVSLGGDISTAGSPPAGGWPVHVAEDHRATPDSPGQRIALSGGGLATSSTTVRRWRHGGELRHHILDPRTGRPARGPWRTATVAAASCVDANTASTAALVHRGDVPAWLGGLGLAARLVDLAGGAVAVGDWPAHVDGRVPAL